MFVCESMYKTPSGFYVGTSEEKTAEEAEDEAMSSCKLVGGQMIYLSTHEERDERTEEGREEPPATGEDVLGPEVVPSGEDDEAPGHGNALLGAATYLNDAVRSLRDMGIEDDIVLVVGDGDEMKLKKLGKHRLLVNGAGRVFVFKAPL